MGETKKHHYVPVFYQNHFSNLNGLVFVYDRKRQTYQELHPRSVCVQSDFYAIKPNGGQRDRRIETTVLNDFDGRSAEAIRKLATLKPPEPETLAGLAVFAALQYLRVPTNDTLMRMIYSSGGNDLMELMSANVERMEASMRRS
jgi:hypothetical protein